MPLSKSPLLARFSPRSRLAARALAGIAIASGFALGVPLARAQVAGKTAPTGLGCRTSGASLTIVDNVLTCVRKVPPVVESTTPPACPEPVKVDANVDMCLQRKVNCTAGFLVIDYQGTADACVKYKGGSHLSTIAYEAPVAM